MKKDAVLAQIRQERIVALAPALDAERIVACARALAAGGLHSMELATTTPAVVRALEEASAVLPDFNFGLGTVLDPEAARSAILAGARFIVTPSPRPEVVTLCRRYTVPVISGAFTSDDIVQARAIGADAVKLFPGKLFGPAYVGSTKGAFGDVALIPIGGVTPATIAEFLRAGAAAAFAGSSLVEEKLLESKNWPAITARAQLFVAAVDAFLREPAASGQGL